MNLLFCRKLRIKKSFNERVFNKKKPSCSLDMSRNLLVSLFAFVYFLKAILALTVEVPAQANECFYEELSQGEKLTLTYQASSTPKA